MAAGVSDGALIVDTGINTGGVLRGAREVTRAVNSLRDTVTRAGRSMEQAGNGYAQALGEQARAARQMQDETRQLQERVVQLNREMDAMRSEIAGILAGIDPRMTMHDFRMVRGTGHSNLIFDIALPHELATQRSSIKAAMDAQLAANHETVYNTVVTFDLTD